MLTYIVRRILYSIPVLFFATFFSFLFVCRILWAFRRIKNFNLVLGEKRHDLIDVLRLNNFRRHELIDFFVSQVATLDAHIEKFFDFFILG